MVSCAAHGNGCQGLRCWVPPWRHLRDIEWIEGMGTVLHDLLCGLEGWLRSAQRTDAHRTLLLRHW